MVSQLPSGEGDRELFTDCAGRRGEQALITASGDLLSERLVLHTGKTVGEGAGWKSQGDLDCERQLQRYGQNDRGLDERNLQFGFRADIS